MQHEFRNILNNAYFLEVVQGQPFSESHCHGSHKALRLIALLFTVSAGQRDIKCRITKKLLFRASYWLGFDPGTAFIKCPFVRQVIHANVSRCHAVIVT